MKVSAIGAITAATIQSTRKSAVVLRLEAIRSSLRTHGKAVIDVNNKVDMAAVDRLRTVHGRENVHIQQSSNAVVTVSNFKR